jgi:hypothetical protein
VEPRLSGRGCQCIKGVVDLSLSNRFDVRKMTPSNFRLSGLDPHLLRKRFLSGFCTVSTLKSCDMSSAESKTPNGQPCRLLKITEFLTKKPGITDEQFHAHWNGQHVNIAMKSEIFRKKIRKYNQVRIGFSSPWQECSH